MTTATEEKKPTETPEREEGIRVYEVGYHVLSTVKEEDVEAVVASIRSEIEKNEGTFITEGAPQSIKLAYPMIVNEAGKNIAYDRAHFGWIKFMAAGEAAQAVQVALEANKNILRSLVFETVREDTRAHVTATVLREVKRTDTIKSAPKQGVEAKTEGEDVSEKDLDKALEDITNE